MKKIITTSVLTAILMLSGCASRNGTNEQADQDHYLDPKDPLESINRTMWDFNYDVLDEYVLRPATVVYVNYMPQFARTGLLNIAENLEEPSNSLNNMLQGKLDGTLVSLGRFALNSTVGLFGAIDVASEVGLAPEEEAFGEVLGKWGIDTGPYIMIPGLGPSDVRSSVGNFVDGSYSPLDGLNFYFTVLRVGIKALEGRASVIPQEQQLNATSDPYAFVKSAYFQNLEFKVKDGKVEKTEEEAALEDDIGAFLDSL